MMRLNGLKPVDHETAKWALSMHFATQALPIDAAGPFNLSGGMKRSGRGTGDGQAISRTKRLSFCEKHGITAEGRAFHQKLIRKGFPSSEAMRIVKESGNQRYLSNETHFPVARPD